MQFSPLLAVAFLPFPCYHRLLLCGNWSELHLTISFPHTKPIQHIKRVVAYPLSSQLPFALSKGDRQESRVFLPVVFAYCHEAKMTSVDRIIQTDVLSK